MLTGIVAGCFATAAIVLLGVLLWSLHRLPFFHHDHHVNDAGSYETHENTQQQEGHHDDEHHP